MTVFDVAAILIAVAAGSGYVNHRLLRLPPTSGTLLVALVSSLVVVVMSKSCRACNSVPQSSASSVRSISIRR